MVVTDAVPDELGPDARQAPGSNEAEYSAWLLLTSHSLMQSVSRQEEVESNIWLWDG